MSDQTPAAWYPDPQRPGQLRYWNGSAWTNDYAPSTQSVPPSRRGVPTGVKVLIGAFGVLVLMGACGALLSSGGDTDAPIAQARPTAATNDQSSDQDEATAEQPVAEAETPTQAQPEAPSLTVSQENAIGSAEDYLNFSAFSRSGLIEQLEFEGYSKKDATFAVDNVEVNWNEQAAKSAEQYLDFSNFSRSGLIEQLEFEGFTSKQAIYGAEAVGL